MSQAFASTKDCILLNHVNKQIGNKQILENVNLSIPYGSIYGLLGPSGCGKTTTVKLIAGISEATSGNVSVLGRFMPDLELMGQIGYMAQSDALYTSLSAKENMEFFGALYGIKKNSLPIKIAEAAKIVNLSEHLEKPVSIYSGGMKRRLSLAISLMHNPKLLVLDEPTVGIDPILRAEIWRELRKIAEDGATILVTTHVMDEAEKCSHLSMMREGRIIASGTPVEIMARKNATSLEEAFISYGKEEESHEN